VWRSSASAERIEKTIEDRWLAAQNGDWQTVSDISDPINYEIETARPTKIKNPYSMSRGMSGPDGHLLKTGGYNTTKIDRLDGERQINEAIGGRRVAPTGTASEGESIDLRETDSMFVNKAFRQARGGRKKSSKSERQLVVVVSRPVCCIPDCGEPAIVLHPEDRMKRLADNPRFVCPLHSKWILWRGSPYKWKDPNI
jgi:hypothetical protein